MRRMDDVVVFAAVAGFLVMALAVGAMILIKALTWQECVTLGYQDSYTSMTMPIKRLCIGHDATGDRYMPLAVARISTM